MNNIDIYRDIATRTNGDIYVGVVGPVRTGKSTFITKMLNLFVLPNIENSADKERTIDEMPQSGDGKSIMTTQPKFLPNESVKVKVANDIQMNVRLIDCVGYLVEGAIGHIEDDRPRMVRTPWTEDEIPFEKAAEIGTNKVINNHSTIGIMVTTDGSITDIPRENYINAEEKTVNELKNCGKPFIIVLNTTHPESPETINLQKSLEGKYNTTVMALNVQKMKKDDLVNVFAGVLNEFPIETVSIKMPPWMQALSFDNQIIKDIIDKINEFLNTISKIGDIPENVNLFENDEYFENNVNKVIVLGEGKLVLSIEPKPSLFYKVLSEQCGCDITDDYHLVSYIKMLSHAKIEYDKMKDALKDVRETGYGVVHPTLDEMTLEEPKIIKQGGKFGVKLRATAPSYHIMKVDLETEVNSLVGNEQQGEDLVKYLMSEFENNPQSIWETKMFGTSLNYLVNEGLHNKLMAVPIETMKKMRKTLSRIVNEGKGGIICILL